MPVPHFHVLTLLLANAIDSRPTELKSRDLNLIGWYLKVLGKYARRLRKLTDIVVADAGFSGSPFVEGVRKPGMHLVSRLRSDSVLYYLYTGPRTGKRGRPRKYDGQIDFRKPDLSRFGNKFDLLPNFNLH